MKWDPARSSAWVCLAAAFALASGAPAGAITVSVGPLTVVNGPDSPVPADASCLAGDNGWLYRQSEVEPCVAADPTDPSRLVASYQQDRWNNGAAQETGIVTSGDGGLTWTPTAVPYQLCLGGLSQRVSDPWVAVSPDGTMYQMVLFFNLSFTSPASRTEGMAVARSTDHGATWSSPAVVDSEPIPTSGQSYLHTPLHDKNTLTADPYDARYAYAVWDNAAGVTGKQKTMFSRTTDGGRTWEPARMIYNPAKDLGTSVAFTQGHVIRVLPDGTLVDLMMRFWPKKNGRQANLTYSNDDTNFDLAVIRSTDRGRTWSTKATRVSTQLDAYVFTPHGNLVRNGDAVPTFAVSPANGNLYAAWQDTDSPWGAAKIRISVSRNGGRDWSSPVTASRTPSSVHAFTPGLVVTGSGIVALTYYDFRNYDSVNGGPANTDAWLAAFSDDGSTLHFEAEARLTDASFDIEQAPWAGGYFLGDYEGLAAVGNDVHAVFVTTLGNGPDFQPSPDNSAVELSDVNQTDVFHRTVTLTP